jgi:hypothetical protein
MAVGYQRLTKQNVICCAEITIDGWLWTIVKVFKSGIILAQPQTIVLKIALLLFCSFDHHWIGGLLYRVFFL